MKIDCKNLPCPEPVLKTKQAWDKLENDEFLEVELNSLSSVENIKRFANKNGIYYKTTFITKKLTIITFIKGYECKLSQKKSDKKILTLILGSIVSAILASSCCLAPLLFLLFGVSMSSLIFLQIFAPYHNYFSFIAVLVLGYLWFDYLRSRKTKLICDTWLSKNYLFILISGTTFVTIFTTYPYWINKILEL